MERCDNQSHVKLSLVAMLQNVTVKNNLSLSFEIYTLLSLKS